MRRPLIDLNVVLDALLERPPQAQAAAHLWAAAEAKRIVALVPAHGVTTLFYLVKYGKGAAEERRAVATVLSVFEVAPVDGAVLLRALSFGWNDFEDAVCAAAAEAAGCDVIVTRDPGGFRGSPLPVVDAVTALSLLERGSGPGSVAEEGAPYRTAVKRRRRR